MRATARYLGLGNAGSFELPLRNNIWQRVGTQQLLKSCHLSHAVEVCLCATGQKSKSGFPVGKKLRFVCTRERFAEVLLCSSSRRAPMNDINFHETGKYNNTLAAGILAAAAAAW